MVSLSVSAEQVEALRQGISPGHINPITERRNRMTYYDLLEKTERKKQKVLKEFNTAMKGNAGWLVKDEIERNPGRVAYFYLAKEFCEELADHIEEYVESVGGYDTCEGRELCDIYQTWYNNESGLYELLPVEAQLFTE